MLRKDLLDQLMDFDRTKLRPDECVISWKKLADELGVSEDTIQRCLDGQRVTLPRWGPKDNSPVFLPRGKIVILKALYFA
jgi:hypothetical protein